MGTVGITTLCARALVSAAAFLGRAQPRAGSTELFQRGRRRRDSAPDEPAYYRPACLMSCIQPRTSVPSRRRPDLIARPTVIKWHGANSPPGYCS
jgi:hypothetical protein